MRFPYLASTGRHGEVAMRPILQLELRANNIVRSEFGLLDSGADVNVMPWETGLQLGFDWDVPRPLLHLSGNLASAEAKAILLEATVRRTYTVHLAFAWTNQQSSKLILGQMNFFAAFDVCFYHARRFFEVSPSGVDFAAAI